MHRNSINLMTSFRDRYLGNWPGTSVLDVGAKRYRRQRTYRRLFREYKYVGMDMEEGDNVDIVVSKPYRWDEIPDEAYRTVISGQTLEHCEFFWQAFLEMGRVVKKGGVLCVIAPRKAGLHRYPVDCWRFLPDGMRALGNWAQLKTLEAFISHDDTVGIFAR